ncbi:MAG TPA: peptidoglycan DD-metalloendopeptidase family protein [Casimicrobium huifangae]|nr:peptidoglycan DD-metalloendopeptidase family protein [Casimicrobium huifangae]
MRFACIDRSARATWKLSAVLAGAALIAGVGHAGALPRESRVPGGVALLRVGDATEPRPAVSRDGVPVWVSRQATQWVAAVGLPLSLQPGEQQVEVRSTNGAARTITFTVKPKRYPVQHVTLRDQAMVEPPADVMARIERESAHLKVVRSQWRETAATDAAFVQPAKGRLSGRFGGSRVLNGKPRAPHAGLDVAVMTGTAVLAPADGVILDIGDYYFCGKTMFIDHGNGLLSLFCHLSEWDAKVGDSVRKGQAVARSGATGRASGPHLHWSVYLNGTSVEPELFLPARR